MTTKTLIIFSLIIIFTLGGYYFYTTRLRYKNSAQTQQDTTVGTTQDADKTKQDSVPYILPQGEQIYNVSHGKETKGPKMTSIIYAPLAIKTDTKQKITISLPKTEVVSSGVLFITTDNMEKQKVTLSKNNQDNTWVGEWTANDTINKRYEVRIYLVGPSGTYDNTMTFL